jgi:catechol 2,3-dioxygenase-like lactoylglutathione lyase family enzyme
MDLNTVRVFVRDIVNAKRFYVEALGLKLSADGSEQGFFVLESGGVKLVVEVVPSDAPQSDLDLVGRFTGLSFDVPNADAAYRDLRSRGVTFTGEPERQLWGGTLATFEDPSGNKLQICEQPQR